MTQTPFSAGFQDQIARLRARVTERTGNPPWGPAVLRALDYFQRHPPKSHYTYGEMLEILGLEKNDPTHVAAMSVLATWSDALFEVELGLCENDDWIPLAPGLGNKALQNEPFDHPVTGERIDDPSSVTFIRYRLRIAA